MDRRYSAIIRGVTEGGAKSGNKDRGPGEWACHQLCPYARIPAYRNLQLKTAISISAVHTMVTSSVDYVIDTVAASLCYEEVKSEQRLEAVKVMVNGNDVLWHYPQDSGSRFAMPCAVCL